MSKHNYFVTFLKKINLSVNSLLEKYLNKLNFSNLSNIGRSNKVFLTLVALIILFLSYLSIPHTYNRAEIQKELENQLLEKFSLNFNFLNNFDYNFFPRPHFVIRDSSISDNQLKISDIKKLRIYVSLDNLFSLENIIVNDVVLENANFNLNKKNSYFFIKLLDNQFLDSTFTIKDSNIFFKSNEDEVLFINKIIKMKYYYEPKELKNIIFSENEIFNIPYSFRSKDDKVAKKIFSVINFNLPKLQIENEYDYSDNKKKGLINLIYSKKKILANYQINKNFFVFNYFDKLINPNFTYQGKTYFEPFYSIFRGKANKLNLSSLFNYNSFFIQLFKTEILNNKNLNIDLSINANQVENYPTFVDLFFNTKVQEGLIDIDNTKFSWLNYADFKISDSLIYINENQLVLDGKLLVDINNYNQIYKFLQISKKLRPKIEKIELNFYYNFDQEIINFNTVKINDQVIKKLDVVLDKIILKKSNLQNKIYLKNAIKKVLAAYVG